MASTDKIGADDQSDTGIDIELGGEDMEKKLRDASAGRKVEMVSDGFGDIPEAPAVVIPSGPDPPKEPVSQNHAEMFSKKKSEWDTSMDATALLDRPAERTDVNKKLDSEHPLALTHDDVKPSDAPVDELPEITPMPPTLVAVTTVADDSKTPPAGTAGPQELRGFSLDDQAPVTEPEPMPVLAVPGSLLTRIIESEDMNEKDKADPKTDMKQVYGFGIPGETFKNDRLLDKSETEQPWDREDEKWDRLEKRTMRIVALGKQRQGLKRERWRKRKAKQKLERAREAEFAARKTIDAEMEALDAQLEKAETQMALHKDQMMQAFHVCVTERKTIETEFKKLDALKRLISILNDATKQVSAIKTKGEIAVATKRGDESVIAMEDFLNPLLNLGKNWRDFIDSKELELDNADKFKQVKAEHLPLDRKKKELEKALEPAKARIEEIERGITAVNQEITALALQIKGIDQELAELAPLAVPEEDPENDEEE